MLLTLTTPLQIVIPRFLWEDKPKSELGRIFVTQVVFGYDYNSSMAFGPIGFLYFAGGILAIFIGFLIIGLVLQIVNSFLVSGYWGGTIIALVLTTTTALEAQFNFYIIEFTQGLILAIAFQFILLKNKKVITS